MSLSTDWGLVLSFLTDPGEREGGRAAELQSVGPLSCIDISVRAGRLGMF